MVVDRGNVVRSLLAVVAFVTVLAGAAPSGAVDPDTRDNEPGQKANHQDTWNPLALSESGLKRMVRALGRLRLRPALDPLDSGKFAREQSEPSEER